MESTGNHDLTWMLDELTAVDQVLHALVLSTDGLVVQKSASLAQDAAELLAAAASSLYSVGAGVGRRFGSGPVDQIIIEFQDRTLFIASAGENARLAVLGDEDVDMDTVAYEMGRLVTRIGAYLGAGRRDSSAAVNGHAGV